MCFYFYFLYKTSFLAWRAKSVSSKESRVYNTIHSHNNEGRQKVVFRYACNLLALCATHSCGWRDASSRNNTTYEMRGCLSSEDQKNMAPALQAVFKRLLFCAWSTIIYQFCHGNKKILTSMREKWDLGYIQNYRKQLHGFQDNIFFIRNNYLSKFFSIWKLALT